MYWQLLGLAKQTEKRAPAIIHRRKIKETLRIHTIFFVSTFQLVNAFTIDVANDLKSDQTNEITESNCMKPSKRLKFSYSLKLTELS